MKKMPYIMLVFIMMFLSSNLMSAKEYNLKEYKVDLPEQWQVESKPNGSLSAYPKEAMTEEKIMPTFGIFFGFDTAESLDDAWEKFKSSIPEKTEESKEEVIIGKVEKLTIDGMEALKSVLTGSDEEGTKMKGMVIFIFNKEKKEVIAIFSGGEEESYNKYEKEIQPIIDSFKKS